MINCAKHLIDVFKLTEKQYISVVQRILNTYLSNAITEIEYQHKIIDILDTVIARITDVQPLREKIPACFLYLRITNHDVVYCKRDIVIMHIVRRFNDKVVILDKNYSHIYLGVTIASNPSLINSALDTYIRYFRTRSLISAIVDLIEPGIIKYINEQNLNSILSSYMFDPVLYDIVVKLANIGYNMPALYRVVRCDLTKCNYGYEKSIGRYDHEDSMMPMQTKTYEFIQLFA